MPNAASLKTSNFPMESNRVAPTLALPARHNILDFSFTWDLKNKTIVCKKKKDPASFLHPTSWNNSWNPSKANSFISSCQNQESNNTTETIFENKDDNYMEIDFFEDSGPEQNSLNPENASKSESNCTDSHQQIINRIE